MNRCLLLHAAVLPRQPLHVAAHHLAHARGVLDHAFLDQHIIAFEVTSLILLIAAVGAVILAKRAVMLEGGR